MVVYAYLFLVMSILTLICCWCCHLQREWERTGDLYAGCPTCIDRAEPKAPSPVTKPARAELDWSLAPQELRVLWDQAVERGLTNRGSVEKMMEHVQSGKYTAEYYITMWRSRLESGTVTAGPRRLTPAERLAF